ncbi:hypothetical protein NHQ30_005711 [Ciborinia camelliae]|nr:hypothetical protein NHQ30_005711 [Ciborinia camelliae]
MQFSAVFLSLLAATAVVAKGNSTKPVTDKALCREMNYLEKLVDEAQNKTELATKTKNNQTKIEDIVAKASKAAVQLDTMQSNATLVSTCAEINAGQQTKKQCNQMEALQKIIDAASNTTKLEELTKGNATKEEQFKAIAAKAQTKLTSMTSNTTLVETCSALKTGKTAEAKAVKANSTSTTSAKSGAAGRAGLVGSSVGSLVVAGVVVTMGMFIL